jgi:hypothetical protein
MREEINTLKAVMESDAFGRFAPFFLEKPMTILNVSKKSEISRQTIIKQLGKVSDYVEQPKSWSRTVKGRPLILKSKILTDYLAQKLNLGEEEKKTLSDIIEDKGINPVIIKGNETIETAISKIVLTILLIGVLRYQMSDETKTSLAFVDTLFGEFLRSSTIKGKKQNKREDKEAKVQEVTNLEIKTVYSSLAETEDEFKNYEIVIKDIAKTSDNFKFDKFDSLLFALQRSKLPIVTYPRTWYEILGFTIEPSLHYTEYLKGKYQRKAKSMRKKGDKR